MWGLSRTLLVALGAVLWGAAPAAGQPAPIPVEAFGNLERIVDAAISPDGGKLAVATQAGGLNIIDIYDLNTNARLGAVRFNERAQLRGVGWADDSRITFGVTETFDANLVAPRMGMVRGANRMIDYFRPGVIDIADSRVRYLSTVDNEEEEWQHRGASLVAPIENDPGFGRMVDWTSSYRPPRVIPFRVNLANGDARRIDTDGSGPDTIDYVFTPEGEVAARADSDEQTNRWRLYLYHEGRPRLFREGVSETGSPDAVFLGLMPDGRLVFYDDAGDRSQLLAVNRADAASELLFQREGREIDGVIPDPWTRLIVGVTWTEDVTKGHYFDAALQAARATLDQSYPDSRISITSWSRDRARLLVYREDGMDGGGYYLFTPAQNRMRRIAMRYPELAQANLGARQSISYRARDGVSIPAYLSLPAGRERNLPLVLLVHGGPHGVRDDAWFDWWSTFLVSRGYAVLQANYRGSSGYGREWEEAGKLQWGALMQTDVEDGVAALVRGGIADPSRVCIVGASYGGYAALAGATLTPDRYRCAVSVAGVSDLEAMLRHVVQRGGRRGGASDFWRHSIGDRVEDRERIRNVSPANLADRVRIPVLLIHGTDDIIVPFEQSELMDRRLRAAGGNVNFVTLTGDDHWLSDAPTRTQMLREIETFLAQHIGAPAQ